MAVKIRLRRMGRRNAPFYRVVAADQRASNNGRFIETLGWYDPGRRGTNFDLKSERIDYWVNNGALLSNTVKTLLKRQAKAPAQPAAPPEPAPAAPAAAEPEPTPAPEPAGDEPSADAAEESAAESPGDSKSA